VGKHKQLRLLLLLPVSPSNFTGGCRHFHIYERTKQRRAREDTKFTTADGKPDGRIQWEDGPSWVGVEIFDVFFFYCIMRNRQARASPSCLGFD
jgi:hypothetical protein